MPAANNVCAEAEVISGNESESENDSFSSSGSEYDECEDSIAKIQYGLQIGDWRSVFHNAPPYLDHTDERYKISLTGFYH